MNVKRTAELTYDILKWVRENGLKDNGGATVASLCSTFGIAKMTFGRWMRRKDFAEAINSAKQHFADNLERELVASLAKSAKGYSYVKRKTEYTSDKDGRPVIKKQITEDVDVQPNVGAAIFLLTNIAPERWQNKIQQQADIQGSLALDVTVANSETPAIATNENEVDA